MSPSEPPELQLGAGLGLAQLGAGAGSASAAGAGAGAGLGAAFFFGALFLLAAFLGAAFLAAFLPAFLADFFVAFFADFFADFLADFFAPFFFAATAFLAFFALAFLAFLAFFAFFAISIILLLPPINHYRTSADRRIFASQSVQRWPWTSRRPIEKLNRMHHRNRRTTGNLHHAADIACSDHIRLDACDVGDLAIA